MALLVGELKSVLDLDTKGFDKGLSTSEAKFKGHAKKLGAASRDVAKQAGAGMAGAERSSFRLQGTLGRLGGVAGRASVGLGGIAKGAGIAGVAVTATAGAVIGAGIKITDYAGRLDLMKKKSATVFGGEIGRVQSWAKANANAMGLTKNEATGLAASFGDLLIPMGFTRKQAADMSTKMIGLSGALSEWSGGTRSAAEVSEILSAAMMGERDALQGLGISISQAEVDAKALEMGLAKNATNMNQVKAATVGLKEAQAKQAAAQMEHGKGSLEYQKATAAVGLAQDRLGKATKGSKAEISDQAAAMATQQLILEKSKDAQTAYANGAGSLARQTAISRARLKEMGETLATKATPTLLKIGKAVNEDVLPAVERFGRWINDNRFQIALAFVGVGQAVVGLVKVFGPAMKFLTMSFLQFVGQILNAAATVDDALGGHLGLRKISDGFEGMKKTAESAFDTAITKANEWDKALGKTEKTLRLKADIQDLESKLKTARGQLADKNLTKERRAQIVATIKDLEAKLRTAHTQLDAKWITKERIAKIQADKSVLDQRLAAAKRQLADPKLTATKKAKLTAEIAALQRAVNAAQRKIDSLKGKAVSVEIKYTSGGVNLTTPSRVGGKAMGGAIHGPGGPTDDRAGLYALSDDEHVVTAKEVRGAGGHEVVEAVRRRWAKGLATGGRAGGATIQSTYDAAAARGAKRFASAGPYGGALGFARGQAGKPYGWGAAGPSAYDCSGFMSAITNYIRGKYPFSRVGSTGTFPWSGFARGPGMFMIGSRRGNPGHMAGTLMGQNVESRGGEGVVVGSRARGANNSLFGGNVWHLARLAAGGRAGDAPFDLFSPRGRKFIGRGLLAQLGITSFDRGGLWPTGTLGYNGSGKTETVVPGDGTTRLHREDIRAIGREFARAFAETRLQIVDRGNRAYVMTVSNG